jgi:hypothetical protein
MLWGGYPEKDALYLPITPARNDGSTVHRLRVGDVPVDGFWSLTVYNSEGYLQPNQSNVYSVNSITAKRARTAPLPSNSAAATVKFPIACRSRSAGITPFPCFARDPKSSTAHGGSLRRSL